MAGHPFPPPFLKVTMRSILLLAPLAILPALDVAINPSQTAQTWEGAGTSIVAWDGKALNDFYASAAFAQMFIDDFGLSVLRINLVPNILNPSGSADFSAITFSGDATKDNALVDFARSERAKAYVDSAKSLAAYAANKKKPFQVISSVWSPPHFMKQGSELLYGNAESAKGTLKMDLANITNYARWQALAVTSFEKASGVKIAAHSIQNEPLFEMPFSSMKLEPANYAVALAATKSEFDRQKIKLRFFGPEHVGYGDPGNYWLIDRQIEYINEAAKVPGAWKALEIFAIHGYGGNGITSDGGSGDHWKHYWDAVKQHNRTSWQTETGGGDGAWVSPAQGAVKGPIGFAAALLDGITQANVSLWCNWILTGSEPLTEHVLVAGDRNQDNPKAAVAKHFFKWTRPGMVRVEVSGGDAAHRLIAWRQAKPEAWTIIGMNVKGSEEMTIKVPKADLFKKATAVVTTASGNLKPLEFKTSAKGLTFTWPAESVITITTLP
jgi:O-glycosyl hydrolase